MSIATKVPEINRDHITAYQELRQVVLAINELARVGGFSPYDSELVSAMAQAYYLKYQLVQQAITPTEVQQAHTLFSPLRLFEQNPHMEAAVVSSLPAEIAEWYFEKELPRKANSKCQ